MYEIFQMYSKGTDGPGTIDELVIRLNLKPDCENSHNFLIIYTAPPRYLSSVCHKLTHDKCANKKTNFIADGTFENNQHYSCFTNINVCRDSNELSSAHQSLEPRLGAIFKSASVYLSKSMREVLARLGRCFDEKKTQGRKQKETFASVPSFDTEIFVCVNAVSVTDSVVL